MIDPWLVKWQSACGVVLSVRVMLILVVFGFLCQAQFKSRVPLVITPTVVREAGGAYVDGLGVEDLVLYDNNVPQEIRMEWSEYPIDLVVVVQTSANSGAVIDKVGGAGILLTQLVTANGGETAVISFSDAVKVHQNFTGDADAVTHAMKMLRKEGGNAHVLDALRQAQTMLEARPAGRRRIIFVIAEKRDRGSNTELGTAAEAMQRSNAAVYWLTYSPFLQPFTVKNKIAEDLKPEAERIKFRKCALCPGPDETPVPFDIGPGGLLYGIGELVRLSHPDLSVLFTRMTGGRVLSFLKKSALEEAVRAIGEEVHREYILSFQPKTDAGGSFHSIRVAVNDKPELKARTRAGYWAIE